jgi:hypothetical protein
MVQNPFIAIITNSFTLHKSAHPSIFIFIDVLKKLQSTTYIKVRALNTELDLPSKNLILSLSTRRGVDSVLF